MKRLCLAIVLIFVLADYGVLPFDIKPVTAGTIIVPDDYVTIQEAVDQAVEGDTIFVRAGAYYEHIILGKSISLVGEEKSTTIVDGEGTGSVIFTTADDVTVTGFTIQNSGRAVNGTVPDAGISLDHVINCNVSGNKVISNYVGIFARPSRSSWFQNNIMNRNHVGIDINNQSIYNVISSNSLQENNVSIHVYYADFNVFLQNNLTDNSVGVVIRNSSNNAFTLNEIESGLKGMIFDGADFNNISQNRLFDLEYGFQLKTYSEHNVIYGNTVENCSYAGIDLNEYACNNDLLDNTVLHSEVGIDVSDGSVNNTISGNCLTANLVSMHFWYSNLNEICRNNITSNSIGAAVLYSQNNRFYHNAFINNTKQINVPGDYINFWDDGYPSGGNYWSNYTGIDLFRGPFQNMTGGDGVGDTAHVMNAYNQDDYPLVSPHPCIHAVAIRNESSSKTVVGQGCTAQVSLEIVNQGHFTETLNVTAYANASIIYERLNLTLESGSSVKITFPWNTSSFLHVPIVVPRGNYTLTALAEPVSGESYIVDNSFTNGWIIVSVVGDISGSEGSSDGKVDMRDVGFVARNFGQAVPPAPSNCDITGPTTGVPDDAIDMRDVGLVARHFGDMGT